MFVFPLWLTPEAFQFSFLRLDTEIQNVLGRQGELHPEVFAIFKGLVLMAGHRYAMKPDLTEKGQQQVLDQRLLRCLFEVRSEWLPLFFSAAVNGR